MLRRGLISFLLSIAIRRYQQQACGDEEQKYAMIIHNDTQREAHNWQWETVNRLLTVFEEAANEDDPRLRAVFDEAYSDLRRSVTANGGLLPSADDGFARVKELITDGEMNVQRVNSDVQLEPLLDTETAELTLRTKANVFIGGSILDRGITVPNLLAFYYGRNPKRVQADTALQHSRMYGARPIADLAVTRFYTSKAVYARLSQIHSLEEALRQAFEGGAHDRGVVFIQSDASKGIIPCSPDKVSLSDVVAVRPNAFLLPTDFNTLAAGRIRARVESVDGMIPKVCIDSRKYAEISIDRAIELIEQIEPTIELDETSTFEWSAMKSLLRYYAKETNGKVLVLAETNRGLSKEESGDKSGLSIIGGAEIRKLIREPRRVAPVLLLLKQRGGPALDWKAGPFWWPVLATPPNSKPCVFAGKSAA